MIDYHAITGVFFDLDGTLMDTASDFIFSVNQLLEHHHQPPVNDNLIQRNVSAGAKAMLSAAFNIPTTHPDIELKHQQLLKLYAHRVYDPQRNSPATLYPGIDTLIDALEERHITWGIVTNKPEMYTIPLLKQKHLYTRSHVIICPDHVSKPKPDPQSLFMACQQTNCLPEKSIYIGDHKRDIEAGKRAGMLTIAALYGYISDDENLSDWQADVQANSAYEILQWFKCQDWKIKTNC